MCVCTLWHFRSANVLFSRLCMHNTGFSKYLPPPKWACSREIPVPKNPGIFRFCGEKTAPVPDPSIPGNSRFCKRVEHRYLRSFRSSSIPFCSRKEVYRRIQLGWAAFGKLRNVFSRWMQAASNRSTWKSLGEAYVQQYRKPVPDAKLRDLKSMLHLIPINLIFWKRILAIRPTKKSLPKLYRSQINGSPRRVVCSIVEIINPTNADIHADVEELLGQEGTDPSNDPNIFTGQREAFTGQAGPTFSPVGKSPFDTLQQENLSQCSRLRRWTPITIDELWTFFSIIMLQSIVSIAVEKEYWKPSLFYMEIGDFSRIMSFHRFTAIKKCLHFVDNTSTNNQSKLFKIRTIIEHLNDKLSFAHLIANKAARVGIKTYELCESKTGYLWKFDVYIGKNGAEPVDENCEVDEPMGATSKIVYKLVRPLLNLGHTLVMVNFYNSPLLSSSLKAKKTDSLRAKNKNNMRTGEVAFSQTKDLTIMVWKDAAVVSLISTYHPAEIGGKEKYGTYKYKPQAVLDYNLSMGGAYPVERSRNLVWYKKMFRRLFSVSIRNSYIIYKNAHPNAQQRQYRVQLADEILQRFRPQIVTRPLPPPAGHFPVRNGKRRARCKFCASRKVDTATVWKCEACDVNLCILGCF
ncbi:hypothetical protein ABMA27_003396 [Loxostege sticticalis]|uniref:PiggyBac transposable element-derived protein domain-containing protein n=1 Tax=Loxostege sticticalis TaxID=481309 RepID=A0ABR3HSZ2_LOXSC